MKIFKTNSDLLTSMFSYLSKSYQEFIVTHSSEIKNGGLRISCLAHKETYIHPKNITFHMAVG